MDPEARILQGRRGINILWKVYYRKMDFFLQRAFFGRFKVLELEQSLLNYSLRSSLEMLGKDLEHIT